MGRRSARCEASTPILGLKNRRRIGMQRTNIHVGLHAGVLLSNLACHHNGSLTSICKYTFRRSKFCTTTRKYQTYPVGYVPADHSLSSPGDWHAHKSRARRQVSYTHSPRADTHLDRSIDRPTAEREVHLRGRLTDVSRLL